MIEQTPATGRERRALARAKAFLRTCKPAKHNRYLSHLLAYDIKSTNAAVIEAATSLGFPVRPVRGTPVAVIGIAARSLRKVI